MSEISPLSKDNHLGGNATSFLGAEGERLAAEHLARQGFRLVLSNFKTQVGRNSRDAPVTGEIDLIAYDGIYLCFIEVKTRSSDEFASPLAAVDLRKQRQIIRTARVYRKIFHLQNALHRYDAVSVVIAKNARPKIELFKNYFNEAKFKKDFWADEL